MFDFIIKPINEFLNGKKTLIGIIGGVATFILVVVNALSNGFQPDDMQVISGGFSALMIAIGITHKVEKIGK